MRRSARLRPLAALLVGALLLALAACDTGGPGHPAVEPPRALTAAEQTVADAAGQDFGLKLFRTVNAEEEAGENVFLSPLSVSMALGMTLNGAEGDTHTAMQEVLALNGLSQTEINESYRSLIDLLTGLDPQVEMTLANSIWHRDDFSVRQPFIDTNREFFDAEVAALDFDAPGASEIINGWVDDETQGKIEKIVPDAIPPHVMMYLINAVYFKGTWQYQFDESKTRDAPFRLDDGSTTTVDMMRLEGAELPHRLSDSISVVDLPYGGGPFAMTLLVPGHNGPTAEALTASLDAERWQALTADLEAHELPYLQMPRFTLEHEKTLNDVLKAMGMEEAFVRSDFSGINEEMGERLSISEVKHKSLVAVDEAGTEAAAATSVAIGVDSAPAGIRADRPFVFVIRERHTDTILFIGKVADPSA